MKLETIDAKEILTSNMRKRQITKKPNMRGRRVYKHKETVSESQRTINNIKKLSEKLKYPRTPPTSPQKKHKKIRIYRECLVKQNYFFMAVFSTSPRGGLPSL